MKQIDITCIIDDDPIFVFGAKRIMQVADFSKSYIIFNNGKEAIDGFKYILTQGLKIPEVILLDINMPVMDGWQFLDEFSKIESAKDVTIFIVSSSIDPSDLEKARSYNIVNDYVLKPISIEKVKTISEKLTTI